MLNMLVYRTMLIAMLMLGLGCSSPSEKQQPAEVAKVMGADRVSQGCIGSAGYTWSAL